MAALLYSASNFCLIVAIAACCVIAAIAEEKVNRQSRQIFLMPQSYKFANNFPLPYYNPYGQLIMSRAEKNPTPDSDLPFVYSPLPSVRGGMVVEAKVQKFLYAHTHECLKANIATDGGRTCRKSSQASGGSIDVKFSEIDQIAYVDITASAKNFLVTLICTDVTDTAVFARGGQITKASDTPRTQAGYMSIVATSTTTTATLKCLWFSHPN